MPYYQISTAIVQHNVFTFICKHNLINTYCLVTFIHYMPILIIDNLIKKNKKKYSPHAFSKQCSALIQMLIININNE